MMGVKIPLVVWEGSKAPPPPPAVVLLTLLLLEMAAAGGSDGIVVSISRLVRFLGDWP